MKRPCLGLIHWFLRVADAAVVVHRAGRPPVEVPARKIADAVLGMEAVVVHSVEDPFSRFLICPPLNQSRPSDADMKVIPSTGSLLKISCSSSVPSANVSTSQRSMHEAAVKN